MRRSGPRTTAKLSEPIHHQLNSYALAAGAAGVGMLALTQPAEGKIIYTPTHHHIDLGVHYRIDLNHDKAADFVFYRAYLHNGIDAYLAVTPVNRKNEVWGTSAYASALPKGYVVGPNKKRFQAYHSLMVVVSTLFSMGPWKSQRGIPHYLGLKFMASGKVHYGWARLTTKTQPPYQIDATVTGYAYETIPGKSIKAGQTKEAAVDPTNEDFGPDASLTNPIPDKPQVASLGALAMGVPGPSIWRRREQLATAK
jgi:hypothetical protein